MPSEAELLALARSEALKTTTTPDEFIKAVRNTKVRDYPFRQSHWFKAMQALEGLKHTPKPPAAPKTPFGDAGVFAGRGIMLGSNRDVWNQAHAIAKDGCLEVVAATPTTLLSVAALFGDTQVRVKAWWPPEAQGQHVGQIEQAENQPEWDEAVKHLPSAIALNSWEYGKFPAATVALVEAYYNEGIGVDFGVFPNYMAQGAQGVVPLCGGYSAQGRGDAESAAIYQHLATWSGGPFPGFWMYAGESMLTAESEAVLRAWKP